MSNATKIILVVGMICSASLFATWNLIRSSSERSTTIPSASDASQASNSHVQGHSVNTNSKVTSTSTEETQVKSNESVSPPASSPLQNSQVVKGEGIAATSPDSTNQISQQINSPDAYRGNYPRKIESPKGTSASSNEIPASHEAATVTGQPQNLPSESPDLVMPSKSEKVELKAKTAFPGIDQREGRVMVKSVKNKPGQNDDDVVVSLTVTEGTEEVSGLVWVIGEYIQRGTTGIMFMPSHSELKLGSDGKPGNPRVGQKFSMRHNTEKQFTIRRPGFEGEELIAIRVGIVDKKTGDLHMARMLVKQSTKQKAYQRAQIDSP